MASRKVTPILIIALFFILAGVIIWVLFFWRANRSASSGLKTTSVPTSVRPLLNHYFQRAEMQQQDLSGYSNTVTVKAELPGIREQGQYVLERRYEAPRTLKFTPVQFNGNGFIKTNVILGYLGRQAHHVEDGKGTQSAITPANYYFQYFGPASVNGKPATIFGVQAKRQGPGLFDGRIYLSPSGNLLRASGDLVQSPSMFVKRAHFIKDYGNFDGFDLPVHIHSESQTMAGHAIMDVYNSNYQVQTKFH